MNRIYLDYNATTPLDPGVRDVFFSALDLYANASSMHEDGRHAAAQMEQARRQVASLIHAEPEEIYFTSGGSESNNTVFHLLSEDGSFSTKAMQDAFGGRKTVITTAVEHPCVMESARRLARLGFSVVFLPVDADGVVSEDVYRAALDKACSSGRTEDKPLLVSVMTANNEIGTIQDVKKFAALAREAGALFHTDAVQAAGKIPVDVKDSGVDYLTLSCHKIYGPKGVGALFVKKGTPFSPLIRGGHQEHGRRAGTYNSPSIIAFGAAAECAEKGLADYAAHTSALKAMLRDGLLHSVPDIRINGDVPASLPNTLDVSFAGAEGESILLMLDLQGISASTGSACASGSLEPSHVLMATGIGPELAHGSIRFSLGKFTTEEEIRRVLEVIPPVIEKLRAYSTVKPGK